MRCACIPRAKMIHFYNDVNKIAKKKTNDLVFPYRVIIYVVQIAYESQHIPLSDSRARK